MTTPWSMRTLEKMIQNRFSELVLDCDDLCDLIMQGRSLDTLGALTVDRSVDPTAMAVQIQDTDCLLAWNFAEDRDISVAEFDRIRQDTWFMPDSYQQLDIAAHVLALCQTPEQIQRVGQELLMFQERNLFDLLRYMTYLVDVMQQHHVIWGLGRGSSVASYVLYLLGVHRVDSMYYDLDPAEFLR